MWEHRYFRKRPRLELDQLVLLFVFGLLLGLAVYFWRVG
jgi:hypothetical protein